MKNYSTQDVKDLLVQYYPRINPFVPFEVLYFNGQVPVCGLELRVRDSEIMLNNIRTLDGQERHGYATMAVKTLMQLSDKTGYKITGEIVPNGKKQMNENQLGNWYRKLGFLVERDRILYMPR